MISANIIEPGAKILLRNNIITNNTTNDWKSGIGSDFFHYEYEVPIRKGHYYYAKATYKYTTTNQKPTKFSMYLIGNRLLCFNYTANPFTVNTEYTGSMVVQDDHMYGDNGTINNSRWSATMFNTPSSGVTGYVKNVILYDVTELFEILKANGIATSTDALKTWCDNNLVWTAAGTDYDITSKVTNSLTNKIAIDGDFLCGNLVEADGLCYYSIDSDLKNPENTYFDSKVWGRLYTIHNNAGTLNWTSSVNAPFYPIHTHIMRINPSRPGDVGSETGLLELPGFCNPLQCAPNKVYMEKVIAKIPKNYYIGVAHTISNNSGGSLPATLRYAGTGNWEEYTWIYTTGANANLRIGFFQFFSPQNDYTQPCDIAYLQIADITGNEYLKNYSALPSKEVIDTNNIFTYKLDSQNLCVNGDGGNTSAALPNSNYKWNKSIITGDAKASIEWVKGAGSSESQLLIPKVAIDPSSKYKISLWVKSKADMSAFYLAVIYYTADGVQLKATNVSYVNGTKTKLTKALAPGDTQIEVSSNANWKPQSYSYLGFRTSEYYKSYCNYSYPRFENGYTGIVKGLSGSNIVLLNKAYTGSSTIPVGTCIVEGFDESAFKYIALKSNLVADTWVKVEATVGNDGFMWDGAGGNWRGIPFDAAYMTLCGSISANNSSGSVYFADIKIEEVGEGSLGKREKKIQIQKLDK